MREMGKGKRMRVMIEGMHARMTAKDTQLSQPSLQTDC